MPTNKNIMRIVKITKVVTETPTVKTFSFEDILSSKAKPGQFLMVWIPRKEEIPLSVMISDLENSAAITIRKNGLASTSLFNKKLGDKIGIRGPYGNSFTVKKGVKNIVLIGGGTGLVPLVRLIKNIKDIDLNITVIIGARTRSELFFHDFISTLLKNKVHNLLISTEDGTEGKKGYPTDVLQDLLANGQEIDHIYTCGPELMMKKVYDLSLTRGLPLEASIERYMKCGIGLCSSCSINDKLVCVDGTVFNHDQISKLPEFGVYYRNKAGILTKYLTG
ncbi:dihydroorotate dehydrogenase electron transfer subunit [Candidatus Nitrosocosmicus franklandus]|uniref:dihydroorotate dehydrogenase electron transfer subunit n=1 Tax=Candidatus Nitrosocosmicus franklandianus TaxID=1798806 RepID=UPI0018D51B41|nr:dihydroorotate dehydrogenase electron transfer subunit [Candidatus Nitrosocosmicus franklandus]